MGEKVRARLPLTVAGIAVAGLVATPLAQASSEAGQDVQSACQIHELPLPAGGEAGSVNGSSPDGRTLVGGAMISASPGWTMTAVAWRNGQVTQTVEQAPGALIDLNSKGVGLGDSVDEQSRHHPWVYEDGTMRTLSGEGTPKALGENGMIVGSKLVPTSNGPSINVPAVWEPGADNPVELPMPSKEIGAASDVAPDGTIVGTVGQDAYVWHPDGTHGPLKRADGVPENERIEAHKLNGPWVVGTVSGAGALRWDLRTGAVDTVDGIPRSSSQNVAVNEGGAVVGGAGYEAARAADGEVSPLPALSEHRPRSFVESISVDGAVVGGTAQTAGNPSGVTERPAYWACS